jgi:hypothetical protein
MDLDEEIFQRLGNTEDHFTERKTRPQRDQVTEAIVAFANSALPNKPGILYIGVSDKGDIVGGENPESWQQKITEWANGCFPEVAVIPRVLSKDGNSFLAVVVPLSEVRPHFARPAFKRRGAKTVPASQEEIDEWITYRNSKVKFILDWKDKMITVQMVRRGVGALSSGGGEYRVIACNPHFVTLSGAPLGRTTTYPLSSVELSMNDGKPDQLLLIIAEWPI